MFLFKNDVNSSFDYVSFCGMFVPSLEQDKCRYKFGKTNIFTEFISVKNVNIYQYVDYMGVKDRLIEFMKYKGISQRTLETQCGLSNGFVDKVGEGTRQSSLDKISAQYPELNIVWLRTGYGEMLYEPEAIKIYNEVRESFPGYEKQSQLPDDRTDRLIGIIDSQQETIKAQQETIRTLSETIKNLTSK